MWIDAIQSPADFGAMLSQVLVTLFGVAAVWSLVNRASNK